MKKKKKKKLEILSENFQFLVVKFSVYLNRRVFVMHDTQSIGLNDIIINPRSGPFSQPTLTCNRPMSAVSALICIRS